MQVTETLNEGLKREVKIIISAQDLTQRLTEKLKDFQGKARIKGFRPGKVPERHLRQMYGKSLMAEIINEALENAATSALKDRQERSAMPPKLDMTDDQKEIEKILAGEADLAFDLSYEILPKIAIKDISKISVDRFVAEVSDDDVNNQIERILASSRNYKEKAGKAAKGDRIKIDYVGKIDGKAFENGSAQDAPLILGSGTFIPGFEEQLINVSAGDKTTIDVTFPDNYGAADLAGKAAQFDIEVKLVEEAEDTKIDDEAAKKLGVESLDRLRELVRAQIESQYGSMTRQKLKRQIFDVFDKEYSFTLPECLVKAEFENLWHQMMSELKHSGKTLEDEGTTEEKAKEEYQELAERRVRLGLILAEIGEDAKVKVSEEELQQALYAQLRQYPGQEKQMLEFFQKNPQAMANLRAPVFEEKVIDYLLGKIKITDKQVDVDELMQDDDSDENTVKKASKKAPKNKEKTEASTKETKQKSESTKKETVKKIEKSTIKTAKKTSKKED